MNDPVENLLREDALRPVADAGFTDRVTRALPRRVRTPGWLRPALVMGSAVAGSAIAALFGPGPGSPSLAIVQLTSGATLSPAALAALALGGALLLSGIVLAFDAE